MIVIDQVDGALENQDNGIKEVLTYMQNGGNILNQGRKDKI